MSSVGLSGQRVLVTGAAGQLGGYLLPALRRSGATVVALARRPGPGIDIVVELSDRESTRQAVHAATPDAIIHAAACTDVDGIERDPARGASDNAQATAHIAEAAQASGAWLVAVSTDMVFPGDGGAPYVEDAPTAPISAYGQSKLEAERAVLARDRDFAVARTAWLYGGAGKHFPRTILTVLRDRGEIDIVDDECGSPTFAGDLAEALLRLTAARGHGVFHLVNQGQATRFDLARETARLGGFDPDLVRPISAAAFLARYPLPARRPADSTLRNLRGAALGITLRDWRKALGDFAPALATEMGLPAAADRARGE